MPFFEYVVCDQGRDKATHFFGGGNIQQKWKIQIFEFAGRPPASLLPAIPFRSETSWSPHKENSEEGTWSAYCNNFERIEWQCFLSKQQIYSM